MDHEQHNASQCCVLFLKPALQLFLSRDFGRHKSWFGAYAPLSYVLRAAKTHVLTVIAWVDQWK